MRNLILGFLLGTALSTYAWDSEIRSPGADLRRQMDLEMLYGPIDKPVMPDYDRPSPCRD